LAEKELPFFFLKAYLLLINREGIFNRVDRSEGFSANAFLKRFSYPCR
jgi:hypothetical protein